MGFDYGERDDLQARYGRRMDLVLDISNDPARFFPLLGEVETADVALGLVLLETFDQLSHVGQIGPVIDLIAGVAAKNWDDAGLPARVFGGVERVDANEMFVSSVAASATEEDVAETLDHLKGVIASLRDVADGNDDGDGPTVGQYL